MSRGNRTLSYFEFRSGLFFNEDIVWIAPQEKRSRGAGFPVGRQYPTRKSQISLGGKDAVVLLRPSDFPEEVVRHPSPSSATRR